MPPGTKVFDFAWIAGHLGADRRSGSSSTSS